MQKLIDKILSFRGDEWRPFAVEVSQDEVRLSVYGGAEGFDGPATAETASHDDLESCLLEQSRLLSPSRAPYHRLPHHRCVFFKLFMSGRRGVEVKRRRVMRAVPRVGDGVRFPASGPDYAHAGDVFVKEVYWDVEDDEVHLWQALVEAPNEDVFDRRLRDHLDNGWEIHREYEYPPPPEKTDP